MSADDAHAPPARKPTIVISGAGSGFGAAMAKRFAGAGYLVAVTDVDAGRAESVLREIRSAGGDGFAAALDVTSGEDWDALYEQVDRRWGELDVLVNNAGVAAAGRLEETPIDDWQWVLDIDLMGVVRGCHRFLPMMRRQDHGHIVNIASFAGLSTMPEISAYITAKSAVVSLSEQLRVDLADTAVGVSVVCPAFVQTRLLDTFRGPADHHRSRAERWMAGSPVSADQVAERVFEAVRRKRFLVLTHRGTNWAWRFKRWAPERYHRTMVRIGNKLKAREES